MSIKYQIFYSQFENGPWILANETPIDKAASNDYSITGLAPNTIYYVMIIPGVLSDSEFVPLISQSVGPSAVGAKGVSETTFHKVKIRTLGA